MLLRDNVRSILGQVWLRRFSLKYPKAGPKNLKSAAEGKYTTPDVSLTSPASGSLENNEFFTFTRGRFICNEDQEMARRSIHFDVKNFTQLAAKAAGSSRCTNIRKYPDGLYSKAFLLTMEDGTEVVGKVPNPNAGRPYFTTASEVATMDFVCPSILIVDNCSDSE